MLKSCTFKICGDEWNSTHKIPVWAINDGLVGGAADSDSDYSSVYIDIKTVEPSPAKWQDIILPTQEVMTLFSFLFYYIRLLITIDDNALYSLFYL